LSSRDAARSGAWPVINVAGITGSQDWACPLLGTRMEDRSALAGVGWGVRPPS